MNHLAHAFLAQKNPNWIIGNIVADFINNKELKTFPLEVQQGVMLHRQIDTFTDKHPSVLKGVARLRPFHHKYAPVAVDVFYDHLLIKNWSLYSNEPLPIFVKNVYQLLEKHFDIMTIELKERLPIMIAHNWLMSTATQKGLERTFERIEKRTLYDSHFELATPQLFKHFEEFEQEFLHFFPEILNFVENLDEKVLVK